MHDLTGFQRDILYVITGLEEPHGLAVKDELDDYYEQEINHGRLYPNLDDLVDKGLLEKGELDKRTNVYTVTKRGLREIEARREWEDQYLEDEQAATTS
ncbi:helix-turn-helix transcriptional regulator [Halovenus rubra]|jgi:DNA-binding PadR family transcriptional regulator|uniref:Helix-turn-helix transcriptional regulator n=3 Tax=Halobacteriales TaxID=2235 RepID=A0ABD5X2Q3_9EURY|nr:MULTISPECIES: helix-turn-helix transcriptional regulator [Halobacteria]